MKTYMVSVQGNALLVKFMIIHFKYLIHFQDWLRPNPVSFSKSNRSYHQQCSTKGILVIYIIIIFTCMIFQKPFRFSSKVHMFGFSRVQIKNLQENLEISSHIWYLVVEIKTLSRKSKGINIIQVINNHLSSNLLIYTSSKSILNEKLWMGIQGI